MKVTTYVISDSSELLRKEGIWNLFVNKYGDNPFLLSRFIEHFMESCNSKGDTPLIIVLVTDGNILGLAPLMMERRFGIISIKFLAPSVFSQDFVFRREHWQKCAECIFDLLFKRMNCQILDLTFEAGSPSLYSIKQQCKTSRIRFFTQSSEGHSILPICETWDEFCKSRGRNFRRNLKKMERKMNLAGSWRIRCYENENISSDVIKKLFDVEETSWKQEWRTRRGVKSDTNLQIILKASQRIGKNELNFKWSTVFLELNNLTIAYCLVLEYKNVAFFVKTSYNSRYKHLYPGIYVINETIRRYFGKHVEKIDFMAILPFHQKWTHRHLPKTRIVVTNGIVPAVVLSLLARARYLKRVLAFFLNIPRFIGGKHFHGV